MMAHSTPAPYTTATYRRFSLTYMRSVLGFRAVRMLMRQWPAFVLLIVFAGCGKEPPAMPGPGPQPAPPAVLSPETTNKRRARELLDEAKSLSARGENVRAAELLEQAVTLDPDAGVLRAWLGRVYRDLRRYDDARQNFARAADMTDDAAIKAEQGGFAAWCSRQLALEDFVAGRYRHALAHLDEADAFSPPDAWEHRLRGRCLLRVNDYDGAAECFRAGAEASDGAARHEALALLGQALYRQERFHESVETLSAVIEAGFTAEEALGWRAYARIQTGDREGAREDFRRAIGHAATLDRRREYEAALAAITGPEGG
jgi:tetratricopeptide (TPR) repeat protein